MPDLFINWIRYNFFSSPSDVIYANQQIFRELNREEKKVLPNTARSPKNENNFVHVMPSPKNISGNVESEKFKDHSDNTPRKQSEMKLQEQSESRQYLQSLQASNVNDVNAQIDDNRKYKLSLGNNTKSNKEVANL
jgi:hypothetical protein